MKKEMSGSILFLMLYPIITAFAGLFALTPIGLALPVLFAFILIHIGDKTFRYLILSLSYTLTCMFSAAMFNIFVPNYWYALLFGFIIASLYFISGIAYYISAIRNKNFWTCVGYSSGAFFIVCIGLLAGLYIFYGNDIAKSIMSIFTDKFSHGFVADLSYNFVAVNKIADNVGSMNDKLINFYKTYDLPADVVIKQFVGLVKPIVRSYLSGILICVSVLIGLITTWLSSLSTRIKSLDFLEKSPIRWRKIYAEFIPPYALVYPKRVISSITITFIAVWFLSMSDTVNGDIYIATVYIVATFMFSLLGIFFIDFMLKSYKLHGIIRAAIIFIVIIPLFWSLLFFVGIIDALFGFRRRLFTKPKKEG